MKTRKKHPMVFTLYYQPQITQELLESIKIGDYLKVNDWTSALRVMGISENFFVMARRMHTPKRDWEYSVVSKKPSTFQHNGISHNTFYCGPDNMVFGWLDESEPNTYKNKQYRLNSPDWVRNYLAAFESGEIEISERRGCSIRCLQIARKGSFL